MIQRREEIPTPVQIAIPSHAKTLRFWKYQGILFSEEVTGGALYCRKENHSVGEILRYRLGVAVGFVFLGCVFYMPLYLNRTMAMKIDFLKSVCLCSWLGNLLNSPSEKSGKLRVS